MGDNWRSWQGRHINCHIKMNIQLTSVLVLLKEPLFTITVIDNNKSKWNSHMTVLTSGVLTVIVSIIKYIMEYNLHSLGWGGYGCTEYWGGVGWCFYILNMYILWLWSRHVLSLWEQTYFIIALAPLLCIDTVHLQTYLDVFKQT